MKNLVLSCYFSLFLFSYVKSQEIQILSADEKEVISSATILFMANDSIIGGVTTDESGNALLQIDRSVTSIEIHSLGYQITKIKKEEITNKIYLQDEIIKLEEVTITNTKQKTNLKIRKLGYPLKYRNFFTNITAGLEIVTLIENKIEKPKKIKSFLFRIVGYGEESRILRMVFYQNKDGKIGKPLLKDEQTIIVIFTAEQKKIKLDISHLNLKIQKEGIFIGFEYIGSINPKTNKKILASENSENSLTAISLLKTNQQNAITYARNKLNEKMRDWVNIKKQRIFLSDLLKENQYFVPAFGIEVYE